MGSPLKVYPAEAGEDTLPVCLWSRVPDAWQLGVRMSHSLKQPSRPVLRNQSVLGFTLMEVTGAVCDLKNLMICGDVVRSNFARGGQADDVKRVASGRSSDSQSSFHSPA